MFGKYLLMKGSSLDATDVAASVRKFAPYAIVDELLGVTKV